MKIVVPEYIKNLMNKINRLGHDVYLVGGYVRDTILNIDCNDYDLVTSMSLEQLKYIIPNFNIINEYGISKIKNMTIKVTSMHHDKILKDLSNRDFTINSMCANASGNIIDPYNGELDLKYKKIRLIDSSGNSLKNDPIRILRAIRYSYTLGFAIDSDTYKLLLENKELLKECSSKKLFTEFSKILMCNNPGTVIKKNKEIITIIIPELIPMINFSQDNPYHTYDVFEHTMIVLNNTKSNLTLRIAALFHDVGKPYCKTVDKNNVGHFLNHQKYSIEEFKKFSKRMGISNSKSKEIITIIYYHDMILGTKENSIKKFLSKYKYDLDLLFDLKVADIKGQNPDKFYRIEEMEKMRKLYKSYLDLNSKEITNKVNGYSLQKNNSVFTTLDSNLSKVLDKEIEIDDYILDN